MDMVNRFQVQKCSYWTNKMLGDIFPSWELRYPRFKGTFESRRSRPIGVTDSERRWTSRSLCLEDWSWMMSASQTLKLKPRTMTTTCHLDLAELISQNIGRSLQQRGGFCRLDEFQPSILKGLVKWDVAVNFYVKTYRLCAFHFPNWDYVILPWRVS